MFPGGCPGFKFAPNVRTLMDVCCSFCLGTLRLMLSAGQILASEMDFCREFLSMDRITTSHLLVIYKFDNNPQFSMHGWISKLATLFNEGNAYQQFSLTNLWPS